MSSNRAVDVNISAIVNATNSYRPNLQFTSYKHQLSDINAILPLLESIYYNVKVYFLPACVVLGTLNNLIVFGIFHSSHAIARKISNTARKYYILLSIGDLACIYFVPFLFFMGLHLHLGCRELFSPLTLPTPKIRLDPPPPKRGR